MIENDKAVFERFSDIISKLKKYFWDVDFSTESFNTHPDFCIERIADGNIIEGYVFLMYLYGFEYCCDVIMKSRRVSDKTKNYWNTLKISNMFSFQTFPNKPAI